MKSSNIMADKGRILPVDPNLQTWVCQNCRNYLCILDDTFSSSRSGMHGSLINGSGSVLGSTSMDHSFVVLPKQRNQVQGVPPRPRSGGVQPNSSQSGKAMEESFVVLPPPAASVYQCDSTSDEGGVHLSSQGGTSSPMQSNNSGLHSIITVLQRAFGIATTQMQVEQPLCLECMRVLFDTLDKEAEDVDSDIKAYEACLQFLEGEAPNVLSEAEFLKEKLKVRSSIFTCDSWLISAILAIPCNFRSFWVGACCLISFAERRINESFVRIQLDKFNESLQEIEEEERNLEAAIKETEKQCEKVTSELKELELKSICFTELEERYWHKFNNFQFQLISHQEERDAILAKIEVSQAHLELLKKTNVLNDAFPILSDGEFGTISNFRLGRLPKILVGWDEKNAAWGQACLLLHTMAQYFQPKFSYRIKVLPMGSYSQIMDSRSNKYELYGPVNLFWSSRYDEAMKLFLTCLKEFAEFANSKDKENNIPPEKCFKLPFKIENDRVGNYSIAQSFNEEENFTRALKYTLNNLKWVLFWFVGNTNFQPLSASLSK
ncbi:beclin-1-like protein isoform X1 [Rhododendron vialii]|uniref:beclin-1-like protein isoform X1 n=1 Tax=Rhododendron vialii TaxID=182163 RepID=UPI00265DBDDC|nr:beclin-1-like protein isoform X1 [Rhododendron vialii]